MFFMTLIVMHAENTMSHISNVTWLGCSMFSVPSDAIVPTMKDLCHFARLSFLVTDINNNGGCCTVLHSRSKL